MGREVRHVPPNWEHPKDDYGNFKPMFDESYDDAARAWIDGFMANKGMAPEGYEGYYWDAEGEPPNEEYYRPAFTEDATWVQMYETVSEGTPVSPPFATKAELVEWIVKNGDGWGRPVSRAAAEKFVEVEWAPTGVFVRGQMRTGVEACDDG
jgi:hypothetical protein